MSFLKSKKIFFFSFISIIILSNLLFPLAPLIKAQEDAQVQTNILKYDWLIATYTDPNLNDKMLYNIGGYDLESFENLGIFETNTETGEVIFASTAYYGFELQAFTTVGVRDSYPILIKDGIYNTYTYAKVTYRDYNIVSGADYGQVTYNTMSFGFPGIPYLPIGYNPNRFDNRIPITVQLKPEFSSFDGLYIGDTLINAVDYNYEIQSVNVKSIDTNLTGDYEDKYIRPSDEEVKITIVPASDTKPGSIRAQAIIEDSKLGVITYREIVTREGETVETSPVGTPFSNTGGVGAFTFTERVTLKPAVIITMDQMKITYALIVVSSGFDNSVTITRGPNTDYSPSIMAPYCVRSVHVDNYFIEKHYQVKINLLANIILDAETMETSLADPYFIQGDWVWNADRGGKPIITIRQAPKTLIQQFFEFIGNIFKFFTSIGGIIMTVIVVVIAIFIITRFRRKR